MEAYVRELSERIELAETKKKDNMDFSRYPFTNNYIPHFYIRTFDNIAIDLENFILRFREIGKNLNLIASHYFYDYLEV